MEFFWRRQKRSMRRFQVSRLKEKRKGYWGRLTNSQYISALTKEQLNKVARTPCPCSCFMCRNARTSKLNKGDLKLTRQEIRFNQSLSYEE